MDYFALGKETVQKAKNLGADMAEAFFLKAKSLTIEVNRQEVETMKLAEERGVGIRTIKDEKMGFAFTSDLGEASLEQTVRKALANAVKTTADPYNTLPPLTKHLPKLNLFDEKINRVPVEEKIEQAKMIERAARGANPHIKGTEKVAYEDVEYDVTIVNSLGTEVAYRSGYCGAYAFMLAEENGDTQVGMGMQFVRDYDQLNVAGVGLEAAQKALNLLGAKSVGTQKATVVLDPYIATNFIGIISPALTADAAQKGKSLFRGKLGQKVASSAVNLTDDGMLDGGIASAPVDGEGALTSRTNLIKDGVLQSFLHNAYTAKKDGVSTTGNGTRSSFKMTPEVGPTNLFIEPGEVHRDELIKEVKNGFYITDVMGMHTANPISGDFSVGAAGLWIKDGEFSDPVRGVAIAGNIVDLLSSVDLVADDLRFFGSIGSPTLRIAKMTISGT